MTARRIHFAIEALYATLSQPLCQQHRDAFADSERECEMTADESRVSCRRCLRALGFEPAPVEQLTEVQPDPFGGRVAA